MSHTTHHTPDTDDILHTYTMLRKSDWPKQRAIIEVFNRLGSNYASEYARIYRVCNNHNWKQYDGTRNNSKRMSADHQVST